MEENTQLPRTVATFLAIGNGQLVFGLRKGDMKREPGRYGGFAGSMDSGEGITDAAARELKEETGVRTTTEEMGWGWLGRLETHAWDVGEQRYVAQISEVFYIERLGMKLDELVMSTEHTRFRPVTLKRLQRLEQGVGDGRLRFLSRSVKEVTPRNLTTPMREILLAPPDICTLDRDSPTIYSKLVSRLESMGENARRASRLKSR